MKKRQCVKKIRPGNPKNEWNAFWGRLADSPAAYAHTGFLELRLLLENEVEGAAGSTEFRPMLKGTVSKARYLKVLHFFAVTVMAAFLTRNARFFHDAAEIVEAMDDTGRISPGAPAYFWVARLMRAEAQRNTAILPPVSQWTRKKLLDFLRDKTDEVIDDRTLTRIIGATGVKLRPERPGKLPQGRRRFPRS